jgi:hypothetical protein
MQNGGKKPEDSELGRIKPNGRAQPAGMLQAARFRPEGESRLFSSETKKTVSPPSGIFLRTNRSGRKKQPAPERKGMFKNHEQ